MNIMVEMGLNLSAFLMTWWGGSQAMVEVKAAFAAIFVKWGWL